MSASPDLKPCDQKTREAEYQALWQVCDRSSRKADYIYADQQTKTRLLSNACHSLIEKRRRQGKVMGGIDIASMVDLHIKREINARLLAEARLGRLPSPAPNPVPFLANPAQYNANPASFNANPVPYANHNAYGAMPQQPQRVSPAAPTVMAAPELDGHPVSLRNEIINIRQDLAAQRQESEMIINTLNALTAKVSSLEKQLRAVTGVEAQVRAMQDHERVRAAAYPQPMFPMMMNYPEEGIEGRNGGPVLMHPRPMTPRSQTQGRDEVDRERFFDL
ncbi:hypothetical protein NW762_010449 [Fusarium torreyae]|uniref:Uncharacterized protein n=1 Tax=Fusarium torreyae TaxID=1237075 RepID=A0A9W8RU18_9HYPO|nr:hypothetical protein NW762_010449 [Fusarium torreyae]